MVRIEDDKRRELKRKRIMQAALKVFSKKGYSPAALEEVAREAGIAKGTLYLYFQDKEDLFSSTILFVIDNLASFIQKNLDESMGPIETLERLAYSQLKFFSQNRDFFGLTQTILSGNLLGDHKRLFESLKERIKDLTNFLTQVIEKGKDERLIRGDIETEEIVSSYVGMIDYSINQMTFQNRQSAFDIEKKAKTIMKILLEGVSNNH